MKSQPLSDLQDRENQPLLRSINRMGDLNPEWTLTGAVSYNGHNVYSPRTDTVELRKEIGMVFQQPNPFPMSIYENVVYGPSYQWYQR